VAGAHSSACAPPGRSAVAEADRRGTSLAGRARHTARDRRAAGGAGAFGERAFYVPRSSGVAAGGREAVDVAGESEGGGGSELDHAATPRAWFGNRCGSRVDPKSKP